MIDAAGKAGIAVPLLQTLVAKIRQLEDGEIAMNERHLDDLDAAVPTQG